VADTAVVCPRAGTSTARIAARTAAETGPQIPLQIAPQVGFGVALLIDSRVGLAIAVRVRLQIVFRKGPHVVAQIGRRIAEKTHPPTAVITPLEITPGTVLRTVPTVVPGMSI
jgi:hypothetical protein